MQPRCVSRLSMMIWRTSPPPFADDHHAAASARRWRLMPSRHRRRLAARRVAQPVQPLRGRRARGPPACPRRGPAITFVCCSKSPWRRASWIASLASSWPSSSLRDCERLHRHAQALGRRSHARRVPVVGGRVDDRRRAGRRVLKREDARAHEHALAPGDHCTSDASAGVAMPPAQKSTTGSFWSRATWRTRSSGDCRSVAAVAGWVASRRPSRRIYRCRMERRWRAASARCLGPVPASPLERIIAAPCADPAQRFAQVGRAAQTGS